MVKPLTDAGEGSPRKLASQEVVSLAGASLLSAVGSLPLHLMPLIVVALVNDARTTIATAGWIAAATMAGQLLVSLALPAFKVQTLRRSAATGSAGLLLAGLVLTVSGGSGPLFLGWFVIGGCCGLFLYLGTSTAAVSSRPTFAFSLRLGAVLLLAGSVAGALQATGVLTSYVSLSVALCLAFAAAQAIGIALYRPLAPKASPMQEGRGQDPRGARLPGLAVVFLLFVGQAGFLAYVLQNATARGMALGETAWALAAMKIGAGLALLLIARLGLQQHQRQRFLELGALLAVSILVISMTRNPLVFFLGLFGLEIALNLLSARLQAAVALAAPRFAGRWLTGTVLLGAAVGPPLHGAALSFGTQAYFLAFAGLSAFLPFLWWKGSRLDGRVA